MMIVYEIFLLNAFGLILIFRVINYLKTKKIYVGYAVFWIFIIFAGMIIGSIFGVLQPSTEHSLPFFTLLLSILALIFFLLIYLTVQLSILSNRINEISEYIALKDIEDKEKNEEVKKDQI